MVQNSSRFGLNLFLQFILLLVLDRVLSYTNLSDKFLTILIFILLAGLFYGFFRLFGVKIDGIESFYQNFPIGFWKNEPVQKKPKKEPTGFTWSNLFTFKYLRYLGGLLVMTALISILFQIDWQLYEKILFSFSGGLLALLFAEILKRRRQPSGAAIASLLSFGLVLFGLGLSAEYYKGASELYSNAHVWIGLQALATVLISPILIRYPSKLQSYLFFTLAYIIPFGLGQTTLEGLHLEYLLPSLALLSGSLLCYAFHKKEPGLLFLNLFAVEAILWSTAPLNKPAVLYAILGLFVIHLLAGILLSLQTNKKAIPLHIIHVLLLHLTLLWHFVFALDDVTLPYNLEDHAGFLLIGFASITLLSYIYAQSRKVHPDLTKALLDASLISSGIGFFIEIEGQWSAIVFLAYACAVLSFGLYRRSLRSIFYGFVFLTVSIFKLYVVSPEIFNTVSGSLAVLFLGLIVIGLSYKFEAVKDYVEKVKL